MACPNPTSPSLTPGRRKSDNTSGPIHLLLDAILDKARNPDGLLYSEFNAKTGEHSTGLRDTWGYVYDTFHTVHLLDGVERYRDAVRFVPGNLLDKYEGAPWDDRSADDYADSSSIAPATRSTSDSRSTISRINQFPEWFTLAPGDRMELRDLAADGGRSLNRGELASGLLVEVRPDQPVFWELTRRQPSFIAQ